MGREASVGQGALEKSLSAALPLAEGVRPGAISALLEELVHGPGGDAGAGWREALKPGAVIGRFELIREVGRGGFGVVYEARDRELGRLVAFKAVRAGGSRDVREERLLREAEAAARLSHPNIVTLFDVGRSAEGPYLVMELLRGWTLGRRLQQGPLPLHEAVRVAVEVAKGLAHAHTQGVIHRDLTPGNVFLCEDGQVKLLDLGMAHAFGHRKVDGGTPSYMAPEQWRGAPEDERTDVFALGVLLFEMLAGELPFPNDGARSIYVARPAPALEVPEEPALGPWIGRMLADDPVERPRDGGEVLVALRVFQQELQRAPLAEGGAPLASRPRPVALDAALVARIEGRAAVILGPIAHHIATRASSRASTPRELAEALAAFIPSSGDREAFLRSVGGELRTPRASRESGVAPTSSGHTSTAFEPALLERVARELAVHLGPLAGILVARTSAKARSEEELYSLLASEIPSPGEREAFRKKGPHSRDTCSPASPRSW
jgi:eukaryotic-like serine/threonine-protein kinase